MPEDQRTGVILQHRNRLFRDALAAQLAGPDDITLLGSVVTGAELVQLAALHHPSVAVFEADAPRWSNDRLIALLRPPPHETRVIGLYDSLPAANVIRAYESGVSALVPYSSGLPALIGAIRAPSPAIETARARGSGGLTRRELDVLYLISAGYPTEHVAWLTGITPRTLERHKRQIYAKLNVHDQAHAAATAVRLGLDWPAGEPAGEPVPPPLRLPELTVAVRGAEGVPLERVREALDSQDIRLVVETADIPGPVADVTVVVQGQADTELPKADGVGELVVVMPREPRRRQVAEAWARGVTIIPAGRIGDLLAIAVRAAHGGHLLVSAAHSRAVLGAGRAAANGHGESSQWLLALTPREREILMLIGRGFTMKQTARALGISVRTVENLQSKLFRKLSVRGRAEAVIAARDLGLLEDLGEEDQHHLPEDDDRLA